MCMVCEGFGNPRSSESLKSLCSRSVEGLKLADMLETGVIQLASFVFYHRSSQDWNDLAI